MTQRRESWWASIDGYEDDKIVELIVVDGRPIHVHNIGPSGGIGVDQLDRYGVRLVERVLPAGRAAAAIEKLEDAWNDQDAPGTANIIAEAIELLQAEEIRDALLRELNRPMTILPWSDDTVSPVIKVDQTPG